MTSQRFGVALIVAGTVAVSAAVGRSRLVVHEWGTFLAMNGSNGVTLDGMYHEEHALPAFVHARSRNELRMPTSNLKGETPVVYFYAPIRPLRTCASRCGFPGGLLDVQWYPQADFLGPSLVQVGSPLHARNGRIGWSVDVVPPAFADPRLQAAPSDSLWSYTRDVDAAYVVSADSAHPGSPKEWERFIFYRGLGEAKLPLAVRATNDGRLGCDSASVNALTDVYVVRVEDNRGTFRYLPSVRCGDQIAHAIPAMNRAQPVDRFATEIADDLAARLVSHGLYVKEARAMVNTWRTSYFTTDGIRVLFVLPQSWTDRFIPMTIDPRPQTQLVRVMVGRIELC